MHNLEVLTQQARPSTTEPGTASPARAREQLDQLGFTTDLLTAADILGIGRTKAYQLARHGQFPVHMVRVGQNYRVVVPRLIEALGLDKEPSDQPSPLCTQERG